MQRPLSDGLFQEFEKNMNSKNNIFVKIGFFFVREPVKHIEHANFQYKYQYSTDFTIYGDGLLMPF